MKTTFTAICINDLVGFLIILSALIVTSSPTTVSAFTSTSGVRPVIVGRQQPSFLMSSTDDDTTEKAKTTVTDAAAAMGPPEIIVIYQPPKEFLEKQGCLNWGTWGCGVSKFPWTYDSTESCYLLKGKVTVTPTDGRKAVTFGAGDYVTFPSGMSCTWDVTEAVQKHFMFF